MRAGRRRRAWGLLLAALAGVRGTRAAQLTPCESCKRLGVFLETELFAHLHEGAGEDEEAPRRGR